MAHADKNTDREPDNLLQKSDQAAVVARPRVSWRGTNVADHFVQFYNDDSVLVDSVAGFLAEGLLTVEGAVVIATKKHRQALEASLERMGVDLSVLQERKQYVPLDAEDTLSRIMVNGLPDEVLFTHVVGSVVTRMVSAGFRVRAFGEMVSLLWEAENSAAAIQLEHLWNNMGKKRRFALFCAYPMAHFKDGANDAGFRQVCSAHESFIPVEITGSGLDGALAAP